MKARRVPGMFTRVIPPQEWVTIPNPSYAGKTPRPLKADCHDGTPFLTIRCSCGSEMHMHESSTAEIPDHAEIASTCKGCGDVLVFPPGHFKRAFAQLREEGWLE